MVNKKHLGYKKVMQTRKRVTEICTNMRVWLRFMAVATHIHNQMYHEP